jgi:hypothetical protein
MSNTTELRSIALDALALIGLAARDDNVGLEQMLATYTDPAEVALLNGALLGHAALILRTLCREAEIDPDQVIGSVAERIRLQA